MRHYWHVFKNYGDQNRKWQSKDYSRSCLSGRPLPFSLTDMLPCLPCPFCAWPTLLWILLKKEAIDKFFPKYLPSLVPDTARCSIPILAIESCVRPFAFLCFFIITVVDYMPVLLHLLAKTLKKKRHGNESPLLQKPHQSLWRQCYFKHTCSSLLSAAYLLPKNITTIVSLCYWWKVSHDARVLQQRKYWNPRSNQCFTKWGCFTNYI